MPKITQQEVIAIARMAHIDLYEHEIEPLMKQLDSVLTYAERVKEVADQGIDNGRKNINVWRDDVVIPTNPEPLLQQAPEQEEHYFVVPRILDSNQ